MGKVQVPCHVRNFEATGASDRRSRHGHSPTWLIEYTTRSSFQFAVRAAHSITGFVPERIMSLTWENGKPVLQLRRWCWQAGPYEGKEYVNRLLAGGSIYVVDYAKYSLEDTRSVSAVVDWANHRELNRDISPTCIPPRRLPNRN